MKRYRSPREVLAEIDRVIAGGKPSPHPPSPLDRVAKILYEGRHYYCIGIYLVAGGQVVRQAFRGPEPPGASFALGAGNAGAAAQSGEAGIVTGAKLGVPEARPQVVAPIKTAAKMLGVVKAESERALGGKDRVLLKQVATRLARFLSGDGRYLVRKLREAAREAQTAAARSRDQKHQPASEKSVPAPAEHSLRPAAGELSRK